MGMLINAGFQAHAIMRQGTERAASALAITLVPAEVRLPDDLDAAFHSLARERVEAVLVLQDPMSLAERRRIAMLAMAARLPTMFGFREYVEAGGLMSYGLDLRANFRRGADYVDKILKGTKPADLPVELSVAHQRKIRASGVPCVRLASARWIHLRPCSEHHESLPRCAYTGVCPLAIWGRHVYADRVESL